MMNREQFMEELEKLLSDIPESEKDEVLDFYEGYFDDAGEENESEVIAKFGSPEKLALSIKYNLKESNDEYAEYTEWGYEDTRTREEGEMPDQYTVVGHSRVHKSKRAGNSGDGQAYNEETYHEQERKGSARKGGNAKLILFIIIMVFLAPVLKGLVSGVLIGAAVAITVAVGLPVIGIIVVSAITLALGVAGIVMLITAVPLLVTNIAVGILLIGLGLFFLAAVFIGLMVIRWMAATVLPRFLRRFTETCRRFIETLRRFLKRLSKGGNRV